MQPFLGRSVRRTAAVCALVALVVGTAPGQVQATGPAEPYLADQVPVAEGCIVLDRAWAGVKVWLVQRRLGTTHEKDRYGPDTARAVRAFQERRQLAVTGTVDRVTWEALGVDRRFCIDRFTVQPDSAGPAKARIEAMIDWAEAQVGRRYVWGGAGPIGFDCSGLALQAMYAGGRVVPAVTTYLHQRQDFATASTLFDSGLRRVPLDQRRRGDLVFYGPPGSITHMAIYLGKGRVLEAVRPRVRVASLWAHDVPVKARVVRPFGR